MVYSDVQIAATLYRAGFRRMNSLLTGIQIVLAESGGDSRALGDGGKSRGWWQIYRPAHPTVTDSCAYDPLCSSRYAFRISAGGTVWQPWSVWKNGAYRAYRVRAVKAYEELHRRGYKVPLEGDARGPESYDLKDAAGDVAGAAGWFADVFDDLVRRIGFAVIALVLLVIAAYILVKKSR